jgi:hypothetical protein
MMNRRDFLKVGGLFSTALVLQFNSPGKAIIPVEVQAGSKHYRTARDGRVFISENAGKTWQMHTDFGSEFTVLDMTADAYENIHALFEFSGYTFQLILSPNDKAWRTN